MSDLISRKALFEKLEEHIEYADYDYYHEEPFINLSWEMVEDIVGTVPSVQQWIPCSERLPETDKNRKYLVCGEKGGIYIAEFVCNTINGTSLGMSWWSAHGRYCPNPIAWMPLPEPYKGE